MIILYTPDEVAEILKVKPATIRDWLRSGELKGIKLANQWRIRKEDLDDFLEKNKTGE